MRQTRTLRRVGGSVMVPVPPAQLAESGLAEGDIVVLDSEPGRLTITPAAPELDTEFIASVGRIMHRYRRAWEQLARL